MDFNSVFNRAPSTGLSATSGSLLPIEGWSKYVSRIAYGGRTEESARKAKEIRDAMVQRIRSIDTNIRTGVGQDITKLEDKLDRRQAQTLVEELDRFIVSRDNIIETRKKGVVRDIKYFVDEEVGTTLHVTFQRFFEPIAEFEWQLKDSGADKTPPGRRTPDQKRVVEVSADGINDTLFLFKMAERYNANKYKDLTSSLKRKAPAHLHRIIDTIVKLFVHEPYELGILYIRSNYPWAIGAFNGLEEGGAR